MSFLTDQEVSDSSPGLRLDFSRLPRAFVISKVSRKIHNYYINTEERITQKTNENEKLLSQK